MHWIIKGYRSHKKLKRLGVYKEAVDYPDCKFATMKRNEERSGQTKASERISGYEGGIF